MTLIYHAKNRTVKALNRDFNKPGGIPNVFEFHNLKPAHKRHFNICDGFVDGFSLRKTHGKGKYLGESSLILLAEKEKYLP